MALVVSYGPTGGADWFRAFLEAQRPMAYRLGAEGLPGQEGDCSWYVTLQWALAGMGYTKRWTVKELVQAVGWLHAGLPGPDDVGAFGVWNNHGHTGIWDGRQWWMAHGSTGTPSGGVGANYWTSAYQGWAEPPRMADTSFVPRVFSGVDWSAFDFTRLGDYGSVAAALMEAYMAAVGQWSGPSLTSVSLTTASEAVVEAAAAVMVPSGQGKGRNR